MSIPGQRTEQECEVMADLLLRGYAYKELTEDFSADDFECQDYRNLFNIFETEFIQQGKPVKLDELIAKFPAMKPLFDDITFSAHPLNDNFRSRAAALKNHHAYQKQEVDLVESHHGDGTKAHLVDGPSSSPDERIKGIPASIHEMLQKKDERHFVNAPQDFVEGCSYYAVRLQSEWYLLGSKGELISFHELQKHNIELRSKQVEVSQFSNEGIRRFLIEKPEVSPAAIFGEICRHLRRFIVLKDQDAYSFLALWAIGTYVFRVFRYYPYVHLNAEKRSGKTLLMDVLRPICFNGDFSVSSTEAVIYRDVQNNSPTMFLDEMEACRKEDKERHAAVMNILKSGFQRGGMAKRCGGKDKDKVHSFSTYSPKMLAGINELDDVLRDRTIRIRMVRKLRYEKVERYRENRALQDFQTRIRDLLYIFGLTYGPQLAALCQEHDEDVLGLDHLNDREFDIWMPILLLANVVDASRCDNKATVTDAMIQFSKKQSEERTQDDLADNDTARLLAALNQMFKQLIPVKVDGKEQYFETGEVFEFFHAQDEFTWLETKSQLTKRLARVGIRPSKPWKVDRKNRRVYIVDREAIMDLTNRYCPEATDSVTVTESVTADNVQ